MESKRKIDPDLGLFLFHAIDKSEYTQEKIAEELGVSREAVNMYCSGKRKPKSGSIFLFDSIVQPPGFCRCIRLGNCTIIISH